MKSDLQKRMDRLYQRKVVDLLEDTVKYATKILHAALVEGTPVGNPSLWQANQGKHPGSSGWAGKGYVGGTARASWTTRLDVPLVEIREPGKGQSGDEVIAVVSNYTIGRTAFVSNGAPYIRRLNDGHSGQQPNPFIDDSIELTKKEAAKYARRRAEEL